MLEKLGVVLFGVCLLMAWFVILAIMIELDTGLPARRAIEQGLWP